MSVKADQRMAFPCTFSIARPRASTRCANGLLHHSRPPTHAGELVKINASVCLRVSYSPSEGRSCASFRVKSARTLSTSRLAQKMSFASDVCAIVATIFLRYILNVRALLSQVVDDILPLNETGSSTRLSKFSLV